MCRPPPPSLIRRKAILNNFLQIVYAFMDKISLEKDCCYSCLDNEIIQEDPDYIEVRKYGEDVYEELCGLAIWWKGFADQVAIYSEHLLVEGPI